MTNQTQRASRNVGLGDDMIFGADMSGVKKISFADRYLDGYVKAAIAGIAILGAVLATDGLYSLADKSVDNYHAHFPTLAQVK